VYLAYLLAVVMALGCLTQLTGCGDDDWVWWPTGGGTPTGGTTVTNDGLTFTNPNGQTITVSTVTNAQLPTPIDTNCQTFVKGFKVTASGGVTTFTLPVTLTGTVPTTIPVGTTLVLERLQNNAWVDVATFTVKTGSTIVANLASTTLPGLKEPGTFVLYEPKNGCNTAVSNLGVVFIADDGNAYGNPLNTNHSVQVINLFDAAGKPLATPTIKFMNYSTATDIDGQALTPDGSQGVVVDGGNTLRFFSRNTATGAFVKSSVTLDVSAYGGDGDSVAIMPNGDEAVVSADSPSVLLLVSGINSGVPKTAETITVPGNRDGLALSIDGKVLLARGPSGLTVFTIASITPVTGALGGKVSHSFTQTKNYPAMGNNNTGEDGREGMAISPTDSNRAVVIGVAGADITLLTGLTTATPTAGTALTLTGGVTYVYCVSITPDGKTAIVGTDKGIVMVSGVDTGTLKQVGTPFAPTFTNTGSQTLGTVYTLGITLDGKYAVVCAPQPAYNNGTLLVIPITATGFSAPVGQLNGIAPPDNDQLLIH
jgi:hypothetical protein